MLLHSQRPSKGFKSRLRPLQLLELSSPLHEHRQTLQL